MNFDYNILVGEELVFIGDTMEIEDIRICIKDDGKRSTIGQQLTLNDWNKEYFFTVGNKYKIINVINRRGTIILGTSDDNNTYIEMHIDWFDYKPTVRNKKINELLVF